MSAPPASSPRRHWGDEVCRWVSAAAALAIPVVATLLAVVLIWRSLPAIQATGWHFFTTSDWNIPAASRWEELKSQTVVGEKPADEEDDLYSAPTADRIDISQPPPLGALAFVYGTLVSSAIAMLIAVPFGVGTAAFLSELARPWVRRVGTTLVEMLAAVPSVVYGYWGAVVLGPWLNSVSEMLGGPNFGGVGLFPAGIILGIMVLPYVCAVSYDVCQSVPKTQREAALALAATPWQTIWTAVLPYARPGIIAGCFIALGRALGETMAVTMLIGNTPQISLSIFSRAATIPSVIANELPNASFTLHRSALIEMGLVLFLVTLLVNIASRLLLWRVTHIGPPTLLGRAWERLRFWLSSLFPSRQPSNIAVTSRFNRVVDVVMRSFLGGCLILTVIPLFLILGYIVLNGTQGLSWDFFTELPRPQGETGGGLAHAFVGSFALVGLAALVAVPIGVLGGIFLAEYRSPRLGPVIRFIAEAMGGVPSIIIGVFAYALIIEGRNNYFGWAGAFALGVMMLPIMIRTTEEALKLVPDRVRQASLALGATHVQTLLRVTLPSAAPAILTAIFLSISRVIGETAPLLLTAGTNNFWPRSMNEYVPSIPSYIYYYATNADEYQQQQAWAAALVLMAVVLVFNYGIRALTGKRVVLAAHAD